MKRLLFVFIGVCFGIVLYKSEAASWFRIYEMFRFESFHMFGIIGGAVVVSAIIMQLFKSGKIKDINGNQINPKPKKKGVVRTLVGGTFFGLGWGVSGACAAPVFVILGFKWLPALIILLGALIGAFIYGLVSKKLPN